MQKFRLKFLQLLQVDQTWTNFGIDQNKNAAQIILWPQEVGKFQVFLLKLTSSPLVVR